MRRTGGIQLVGYRSTLDPAGPTYRVAHRDVPVLCPGGRAKQDARAVLSRGMTKGNRGMTESRIRGDLTWTDSAGSGYRLVFVPICLDRPNWLCL